MNHDDFLDSLNRRAERRRASDRAVARAAGITVAELDQDTTRPDESGETAADIETVLDLGELDGLVEELGLEG